VLTHETWTLPAPFAAALESVVLLEDNAAAPGHHLRWDNARLLVGRRHPGFLPPSSYAGAEQRRSQSLAPPSEALPGLQRIEVLRPGCEAMLRAAIGKTPEQYSCTSPSDMRNAPETTNVVPGHAERHDKQTRTLRRELHDLRSGRRASAVPRSWLMAARESAQPSAPRQGIAVLAGPTESGGDVGYFQPDNTTNR
jgi:hypothetical protein